METTCSSNHCGWYKHLFLIRVYFERLWFQFLFLSLSVVTFKNLFILFTGSFAFPGHCVLYWMRQLHNCDQPVARFLYHHYPQKMSCERHQDFKRPTHGHFWSCIDYVQSSQTLETVPGEYPVSEMLTYNREEHNKIEHSVPVRKLLLCIRQGSPSTHEIYHHTLKFYFVSEL